jgi:hypothetical protein
MTLPRGVVGADTGRAPSVGSVAAHSAAAPVSSRASWRFRRGGLREGHPGHHRGDPLCLRDRVLAGPLRPLDQRHGRGLLAAEQLFGPHPDRFGLGAGRKHHGVVAQHLRIDVDLAADQRTKRR